jgi:hypothetical protein
LGRVVYSMFFGSKMSSMLVVLELFLLLLLLLLFFWLKKNSRISVFLFSGLFFLITSLGLSISMNSGGFVERGLLNANAVLSVFILCLDRPSRFFLIKRVSVGSAFGSDLLAVNSIWGRGFGIGNVILISFTLGDGVLITKLFISDISFCTLSSCLGVRVLNISVSICSIWIWLNLIYEGDFSVNAFFG